MYNFFKKNLIFSILLTFFLCSNICFAKETNFFEQPQNTTQNKADIPVSKDFQNKTIRVLLSNKGSFEHEYLEISSDEELFVTCNNQLVTNSNIPIKITVHGDYFYVEANGTIQKVLINEKLLAITSNAPIKINNFRKAGAVASYKGLLEISSTKSQKLRVINIIDIEDYLKGVVPNEMPVYFGLEALKAQSIAARGYAYRDAVYKMSAYDVCDTTGSQVYNGYNSYSAVSNRAVNETMGQFALYNGNIILSLYSSTAGGYTENYENVFSLNGKDTKFPANPIPYLKGVPDYDYNKDLTKEKNADEFYSNKINSFDINSPKYRWEYVWDIDELEDILANNFVKNSNSKFVAPSIKSTSQFGKIKYIDVPQRGVSGKAMYVRITTDKGVFLIAKEIMIRKIFQYKGSWLPSANIVFEPVKEGRKLTGYKVKGGGFGHGVGLSQFGASQMAKQGYTYDKILQHYYTDIVIGSYPVECKLNNIKNCKTTFYSADKKGYLVIKYSHKPHNLVFNVNGSEILVATDNFHNKEGQININKYLKKGINSIELISTQNNSADFYNKSIKFYVELAGQNEK